MLKAQKVGGVLLQARRLLVVRIKGEKWFVAPGGSVEFGENLLQALTRELKEELSIDVLPEDCTYLDVFSNRASTVNMAVFSVTKFSGMVRCDNEIEEVRTISSSEICILAPGSVFAMYVVPLLKRQNLLD